MFCILSSPWSRFGTYKTMLIWNTNSHFWKCQGECRQIYSQVGCWDANTPPSSCLFSFRPLLFGQKEANSFCLLLSVIFCHSSYISAVYFFSCCLCMLDIVYLYCNLSKSNSKGWFCRKQKCENKHILLISLFVEWFIRLYIIHDFSNVLIKWPTV